MPVGLAAAGMAITPTALEVNVSKDDPTSDLAISATPTGYWLSLTPIFLDSEGEAYYVFYRRGST